MTRDTKLCSKEVTNSNNFQPLKNKEFPLRKRFSVWQVWKIVATKYYFYTHLYPSGKKKHCVYSETCVCLSSEVHRVWQYGLWSFQTGDTKLERFLPKNQLTERKLLNFEFWINGELSKSAKI